MVKVFVLCVFVCFMFLFSLSLSSAFLIHTVTPNYTNRSMPTIINFTINNTEASNITNITFTLPMEARFYTEGTNTSAVGAGFANLSQSGPVVLTWVNTSFSKTGIIPNVSGSLTSFWFNVSIRNLQSSFFTSITITTRNTGNGQNESSHNYIVFFEFGGSVKNETGSNESNVNVSIYQFVVGSGGPPTEALAASTLTDGNGSFSFPSLNGSVQLYTLKMIRYGLGASCISANDTCNATKIGSILPAFPPVMYYPTTADLAYAFEFMRPPSLNGTSFYLNPAVTLRLYAYGGNGTKDVMQKFGYQVVDQVIGFPSASNVMASVNTTDIVVPLGRNYTAMFARAPGFGGGFGFAFNFACNGTMMNDTSCPSPPISNSTLGTLTAGQILVVNQSLNVGNYRLTGCVNLAQGNNNTVTLNVTSISLKMVPWTGFIPPIKADRGDIDITNDVNYSVSGITSNTTALNCSGSSAFYNISVMGAATGLQYMLEVYAKNVSSASDAVNPGDEAWKLAAFQNITVTGHTVQNVTLRRLAGTYWSGGLGEINTSTYRINIQNSTGGALTKNMNANLKVKNPAFGTMNYIIESMSSGTFYVRILNNSNWAKVMIFASDAPPKEITLNLSANEHNITLTSMSDGKGVGLRRINESGHMDFVNSSDLNSTRSVNMRFLRNTGDWGSGCNTVDPTTSCQITTMQAKNFNPLNALVAGKINMEMKVSSTNVTLTFVNFDMFAAKQPPMDSIMNENATSTGSAQDVWKFGSFAPANTYDHAIIGMPYSDTSIDESANINLSAPYLYDENFNLVWNSSRGDTSANLTDDFIDYNSSSLYRGYLLSGGINCSKTEFNMNVTPCFVNTSSNMIYMKVPHFSGVGPTVSGSAIAASTPAATSSGGGGGGGGTVASTAIWTQTYSITSVQANEGYTVALEPKARVKVNVENEEHSVGVLSVGATSVTIQIASTPQNATLSIGETRKFEVSNDTFYDLKVTLNSIRTGKANVTISSIREAMIAPITQGSGELKDTKSSALGGASGEGSASSPVVNNSQKKDGSWATWIIIIGIVLVIAVLLIRSRRR